jgi:hypothetical protein
VKTRKILFVVSADLPNGSPPESIGPRKDYVALIQALQPAVLDRTMTRRSAIGRLVERCFGIAVAQAVLAFWQR